MTRAVWRVHILYISASFFLFFFLRILMFFSLRLNSPPFLSVPFSLLIMGFQVIAYHKQMQHERLQNGEELIISTKKNALSWNSSSHPGRSWEKTHVDSMWFLLIQLLCLTRCAGIFEYLFGFLLLSLDPFGSPPGWNHASGMYLNGWK